MDRIGHRRLQFIGFSVIALCFAILALVPALTQHVAPFLALFGLSYFFVQFGPNMTTFVMPSEVFPVSMRTTGHGMAAGIGKLGAFVGVFLVPVLQDHIGLRGLLAVAGVAAVLGLAATTLLPEPAGRTLEELSEEPSEVTALRANRRQSRKELGSAERTQTRAEFSLSGSRPMSR
jgi:MFS family permease